MINIKEAWAIREEIFITLLNQAKTFIKKMGTPEKAEAGPANRVVALSEDNKLKNGVKVIEVSGVMTRKADPWAAMWGFANASTDSIRKQFDEAIEDKKVKAIIFNIDSPGGEVNGTPELAEAVYQARLKKPIVAYVSHQAASAAYWLASACNQVVAFDTAAVGSIGVIFQFWKWETDEIIDIVSNISPKKTVDVTSDEGRQQVQAHADKLGNIFLDSVARNRGVERSVALSDFGQGDIKIGDDALKAGMVDAIGDLSKAIAIAESLAKGEQVGEKNKPEARRKVMKIFAKIFKGSKAKLVVVDDEETDVEGMPVEEIDADWVKENLPEVADELREEGRSEENDRQEEVDDVDTDGSEEEESAKQEAKRDTKATAASLALGLNKMRAEKTGKQAAARQADGAAVADLNVDTSSPDDQDQALAIMGAAAKKAVGKAS